MICHFKQTKIINLNSKQKAMKNILLIFVLSINALAFGQIHTEKINPEGISSSVFNEACVINIEITDTSVIFIKENAKSSYPIGSIKTWQYLDNGTEVIVLVITLDVPVNGIRAISLWRYHPLLSIDYADGSTIISRGPGLNYNF